MSTDTLLVTADFSDCSPEVVRYAGGLAQRLDARLAILHVVEVPSGLAPETLIRPKPGATEVEASAFLEDHARQRLRAYADAVRDELDALEVTTLVAHGPVVEAILSTADELDAALLVLGTHGRHGVSRLLLGSVAERVLRSATRPVLTLRTQHQPTCEARDCAWCRSHVSWAQSRLRAELDG